MGDNIKKKLIFLLCLFVSVCSVTACDKSDNENGTDGIISVSSPEIDAEDIDVGYEESIAVNIELNGTSAQISGDGAQESNGVVTINSEGTYILSGELSNGRIIVDADKESKIRLVFNNVDISCQDNAPIFIKTADKVFITLEEGSENSLSDGESYNLGEDDSNVDGAVFSRADLTLNGTGKLTVNANYKHAVVCKDDLVITGGDYNLTSVSGGLYGKDSILISGGSFNINAGTNAVKSSNTEEEGKGSITIKDGNFNITAGNDGIESAAELLIEGGTINITTGGGSENASMTENGQPNENWGQWGNGFERREMQSMQIPSGGADMPSNNNMNFETVAYTDSEQSTEEEQSDSAKGLKAESQIVISGGTIDIDSSDDSVHCNGNIAFSGSTITMSSGDDGVHADGELIITDGTIVVEKSYEGLEGVNITISGGDINVTASDDGINAAGGSDTGYSDRMGRDSFNSSSEYLLTISGGKININASGDGLDSNGNLIIEGGEVYVSGPTNDGNGAIDYGDGASAWITGGTIVACGSSGMAEGFGEENSTQYSVLYNLSTSVSGGTEITVTDSSGNIIIQYTPEKDFQSIVFSCPELKEGTYTLTAGNVSEQIDISSIVTSNGAFGRFGNGGAKPF